MDDKEVRIWGVKNSYANMRFFTASDDYVSARCCILNGLFSGFSIASQAVEKLLKAMIFLESGIQIKNNITWGSGKIDKNVGHNPFLLKERLKEIKDYQIDKYDSILKKLYDHYLNRYHENKPIYGTNGASSEELVQIDELWFDLVDKMSMPDEVKYRMKFFGELLEPNHFWNTEFWLKKDNKKFKKLEKYLTNKYKEVFKNLYKK